MDVAAFYEDLVELDRGWKACLLAVSIGVYILAPTTV